MRKKTLITALSIIVCLSCLFGLYKVWAAVNHDAFTKQDAAKIIKTKYDGTMQSFTTSHGTYIVNMQNAYGRYQLTFDKDSGQIVSLQLIEKAKDTLAHQQQSSSSLSKAEARKLAVKQLKTNGQITSFETKKHKGQTTYRIQLETKNRTVHMTVQADTGDILYYYETKNETSAVGETDQNTPTTQTLISPSQARNIAQHKMNGHIDEIEKEASHGSYRYEVEMTKGNKKYTIVIQAYTGEVLYMSSEIIDNQNDEQPENQAEDEQDADKQQDRDTQEQKEDNDGNEAEDHSENITPNTEQTDTNEQDSNDNEQETTSEEPNSEDD